MRWDINYDLKCLLYCVFQFTSRNRRIICTIYSLHGNLCRKQMSCNNNRREIQYHLPTPTPPAQVELDDPIAVDSLPEPWENPVGVVILWGASEGRKRQPKPSTDMSNSTKAGRQVTLDAEVEEQYLLAELRWRRTICSRRSVIDGRVERWRVGGSSEESLSAAVPSLVQQAPLAFCWCSQNFPERRRKSLKTIKQLGRATKGKINSTHNWEYSSKQSLGGILQQNYLAYLDESYVIRHRNNSEGWLKRHIS